MRILHVGAISPSCGAGGPNHSIRGLATAQASIGMEVGLLSTCVLSKDIKVEGIDGVQLLMGPQRVQRFPWFFNDDWLRRIEDCFGRPDIVNFHSTYIPFNMALGRLCRKAGWPYVITPRGGMSPVAQQIKGLKKWATNVICFNSYVRHAVAIHALCENEANQIWCSFDVDKIISVSNGVDESLFEINKSTKPANLGDFGKGAEIVLGFVGRIDVYIKGLDLLLLALRNLKEKNDGPKYKLFMIGPFHTDGDKRQIKSMIESFGLVDTVRIVGPKYGNEKWSWFLACDILVYTSRSEGMPMAVLEAMALGKPCLVTPTTNMAGVVCQGGGWRCETEPGSIADAIEAICNHREKILPAGEQSRQLIHDKYTWHKVAKQLCDEYTGFINRAR